MTEPVAYLVERYTTISPLELREITETLRPRYRQNNLSAATGTERLRMRDRLRRYDTPSPETNWVRCINLHSPGGYLHCPERVSSSSGCKPSMRQVRHNRLRRSPVTNGACSLSILSHTRSETESLRDGGTRGRECREWCLILLPPLIGDKARGFEGGLAFASRNKY